MTSIAMEPKTREINQSLREFTAGCLAGFAQVLVGQPFDLVKIRLQTQNLQQKYTGVLDCIYRTWRAEGVQGFYKGTMYPMVGVGASVSLQFGVERKITREFNTLYSHNGELPWEYAFLSGGITGIVNSSVITPLEHLRIRMQVMTSQGALYYRSIDVFQDVFRKYGSPGIYKGANVTAARDFFGLGAYFAVYDQSLKLLRSSNETTRAKIAKWKIALAGGLAGFMSWVPNYPLDIIKSKIQSDSFERPQFKGTFDCTVKTIKTEGVRGLFRGLTPCMARAIPVNATIFLVFEESMRIMGGHSKDY